MKKSLLSIVILIVLSIVFYPPLIISKSNGSGGGGGNTNSPIDNNNCTDCHNGTINSGNGTSSISTNIPSGGYVPGNMYTVTLNVSETGINKFGFETTSEDLSNNKLGTFFITNSSETQHTNSNTAVTHTTYGNSGTNDSRVWTFDWEAPLSGSGDITFYSSALAANSNGNSNGDQVYTSSLMVSEFIATAGCMDTLACNYDLLATVDDSSCVYPTSSTFSDTICDSYTWNGITFTSSATYDTLFAGGNAAGCDSTATLNLIINYSTVDTDTIVACDSYTWTVNGITYNTSVIDTVLGVNSAGCVETTILDLTVNNGGCTDSLASNYDSLATCDDGSCIFLLPPAENLFFSEYAEGSSNNKYFEVYNPTADTIDLTNYAYPMVNNSPGNGVGIYENWRNFDSAAVILPFDVFIVAHASADSSIIIEADMIVTASTSLSNGNDGMALVYGNEPVSPIAPGTDYIVLDWIGTWDGDYINNSGSSNDGWDVAGESIGTANHTIIRKCPIDQGDTSWTNAAGNDPVNSQWIVLGNNDWSNIGQHIISPCNLTYGCTDSLACNYDSTAYIDDGSCVFPGQIFQNSTTICDGDSVTVGSSVYNTNGAFSDTLVNSLGCDSIVQTNLTIFSQTSLYDTIFGGIPDTSVGTGSYYSGSQYLELSCYEPSDLISALIFSQDTTLTTFEISDEFGNVLFDVTETVIPGGYRVYFNYHLTPGANYRLGVNGQSNDLFRHNSGVNYPYNFGTLAAVTSSSAGGSYYYFYYDIELRQSPEIYSLCDGESVTIAGNVYDTNGLYTDSLISSLGCDSVVYSNVVVSPHVSFLNNPTICNGETYLINGNIYDSSGVYIDSLQTTNGCDSVVTTTLTVLSISGGSGVNNQTICMGDYIMVGTNTYFASGTYFDTLMSSNGCDSVVTTNLNVLTANYANINGGILDTVNGPGDFSSYNGHLLLDVVATTLVKSATVYAVDTNTITFELRDANGLIMDDITHTVFPGEQNLIFNFMLPVGTDYQLGISTGNSGLYRSNAGNGNSLAYPFNAGPVSITSSNAGDQYYYFFYDIEFMPFSTYNEVNICIGDSVTVGGNVYDTPGQYLDNFTANNSCDSVVFTVLDFYQSPPLFIQTSPDPPEICIGETVFLEGSAGFSYYWWDNGSTGNSLLVVPLEDTWYLLSAKDSNDCVVKEDIWVFVDSCITGINDLSHINEIQLYPNPASEQLTIDFTAKATTLKVYNMLGELLSEKKILEGQYKVDIDVKDWKSAIYSVQLCYKDRVIANKVFNVAR